DCEPADGVRDSGNHVDGHRAVTVLDGPAGPSNSLDRVGDRPVRGLTAEIFTIDDVPGTPTAARDLLDEAVIGPVVRVVGNPAALLVENGCEAAVDLRVVDEFSLAPACRRGRHRPAVELAYAGGRRGAGCAAKIEAVALAPSVRAQRPAPPGRQAPPGTPRRETDRLRVSGLEVPQGNSGLAGAPCSNERVGQASRVETPPGRAGVPGLSLDDRCAQRFEPVERVVETLDDHPLEPGIALGAFA